VSNASDILIVDDDAAVRSSISLLLKQAGYRARIADGPESALTQIETAPPALCVLDMNFSVSTTGEEGLALLRQLKALHPRMPVILITAWGSIPLAVDGMKAGAVDFVTKPWNNDRFLQSVRTALRLAGSDASGDTPPAGRDKLDGQYEFGSIIGVDPALLRVLETIGRVAATDAPVLIEGESGTGKELIAEALHNNSPRADNPFVRVNLGGIPAGLFESEMFGHKRGAFTDAVADRIGRFETAEGGTILLDEIGELDSSSQVKLLRVLQDHTFEVLGASATRSVDVRVVSATNRRLSELVDKGGFREDLYYRINLIAVRIPPLRERSGDISLLVEFFVDNLRTIYDRPDLHVTPAALEWLRLCPWPGNVRQLKNVIERTVLVTARDVLDEDDFKRQLQHAPDTVTSAGLTSGGPMTLEQMEQSMIRRALELHGANLSRVARALGLSRAALYRRLEKYGITP
jgi:DNA-binding NtrC family response regulator